MPFDEKQRKKLIETCHALPDEQQAALRVLSVIYISVSTADFLRILQKVDAEVPGAATGWSERSLKDLQGMVERWKRLKLMEKTADGDWACNRLIVEVAAREALARGDFVHIDRIVRGALDIREERTTFCFESPTHYLRAMRNALYRCDLRTYENVLAASVYEQEDRHGRTLKDVDPYLEILANPPDREIFLSLPPRMGKGAFESLPWKLLDDPSCFRKMWEIFGAYREKNPDEFAMTAIWADWTILFGNMEEAVQAAKNAALPDAFSMAALEALTRGDRDEALAFYEKGLKALRRAAKKRRAAFYSWTSFFYPLLLVRDGASTKKAKDYLNTARDFGISVTTFTPFIFLRTLIDPDSKKSGLFESMRLLRNRPERALYVFFFVLCAFWMDLDRTRLECRTLTQETFREIEALGLRFLAEELAVLIRELWPEDEKNYSHVRVPAHPLKDLMSSQREWERSLTELSGIGVRGEAATLRGAKRFAWEISWSSLKGVPYHISLTPLEQTLQNSGWSKGKNVSLKRLYRKMEQIPGMTEQDRRAASAIREERGYFGANYYIDAPQALEALAGHPHLFRGDDGGHVEVASDEPRLLAIYENGKYLLELTPFPRGKNAPQRVIQEDGHNCLRVTRFDERHVRMAEILGENGLIVPERARESLLKTLESLVSIVTIHADIEGIGVNAEQVEADSRICVQIQPSGDGLDVEMIVRPLGPSGVPCRPGVGGSSIFGRVDSRRIQARRILEAEKDALMLTLRSCPILMDAEQVSDERWNLSTPEMSLEFLMQLREMGDSVVVEWPKGQTMQVRSQVSMSAMNVSVRSVQDWFALSGEVRVDEQTVLNMKDMIQLLRAGCGRFLPLGGGQFLALTKEFRRKIEALAALGDQRGEELRVSPLSVGLVAPLMDEVGAFRSNADWERQLRLIDEAAALNPALPSTFRGELRNYQMEGYQWMSRLASWKAGACLADDMGLGKTIQTLALLLARGSGGPALVVAPTSVCSNWLDEARRFAPALVMKELRNGDREQTLSDLAPLDVIVTTYGLLQNEIDRISDVHWHTIVLDEAQAIKNMGTKRSMAAMKLHGDFRVITTGTPIENHLAELWNLFRFLNPHFLGSLDSFNRRFAAPIERDNDPEARRRLKKVIQPFILRRSKEQVLEELPPKTEITLRVDMKDEERNLYEALRRSAVEGLNTMAAADQRFQIFAELMRLRRACCNASLVMPEGEFPSAKLEAFGEILTDLRENGHKALVFSQFVDHLTILRKYLDEEKVGYQYLDGSTPPQERSRRVRAFQSGEGDCFLISLKAGGTGLNLTVADYVVHMDPWWNPAVEEQASDRAHRIGQDRPVTVYRIVAKNTIEEKIVDLHAWKRDLAESLLDESGVPASLSSEEMLALIRETR